MDDFEIGISKASVFAGFCASHDHELFHAIDSDDFEVNGRRLAEMFYRTICYELFHKLKSQPFYVDLTDRVAPLHGKLNEQGIRQELEPLITQTDSGVEEILDLKEELDAILTEENYGRMQHEVFVFESPLPFAACIAFGPYQDRKGHFLQDKNQIAPLSRFALNIFNIGASGFISFSFHRKHRRTCDQFVRSFDDAFSDDIAATLLETALLHGENIYFSPLWWKDCADSVKVRIYMMAGNYVLDDVKSLARLRFDFSRYGLPKLASRLSL